MTGRSDHKMDATDRTNLANTHRAGSKPDSRANHARQTRSKCMKRTRIFGYALALAFCACQANAEELTGTLKNIKETGAITLGYRDSSIPFSYLDDNQKPVGFAMDICYKIVDALKTELKLDKLEVKLNPVTSSTRIPLLANGTIDLECGSTTNNAEREKQVAFTNTHFLTASRFVSKKAGNINSIDDLKGKSVVSTAGTTNIKQLTEANAARNLNVNIIPAKDHAEAFLMVETDRAVAFVMDDICWRAWSPAQRSRRLTSSPPTRSRSLNPTGSCCARTIRPSRRWSMPRPPRFTPAAKARSSMTNGSR